MNENDAKICGWFLDGTLGRNLTKKFTKLNLKKLNEINSKIEHKLHKLCSKIKQKFHEFCLKIELHKICSRSDQKVRHFLIKNHTSDEMCWLF